MTPSARLIEKISNAYTPLKQASMELKERWNNKELRAKVEKMFGDNLPAAFKERPRLVMSRSIFTPNRELAYFFDLAKELDFEPLLLEYPDKFVSKNPTKYHLCKMYFCNKDRCSDSLHTSERIVDFNLHEGDKLSEVTTIWGQNLLEFHHDFLFKEYPELNNPEKLYDFLEWFNDSRTKSSYYFNYLSLFICHGILFDNFLWEDEEELTFIKEKLEPSLFEVESMFGVKPLIYPLLPFEHQNDHHWLYYNEEQKEFIKSKL